MGTDYEVWEWYKEEGEDYRYHIKYRGDSLLQAVWMLIKLKRAGSKCIKLEIR